MNNSYNILQSQLSLEDAKKEHLAKAVACPTCKTPASQLTWLHKNKPKGAPGKMGWMTFCDQCNHLVDFFVEQQEFCSWEEVKACRNDKRLQSEHTPENAKREYLPRATPCPRCKAPASQLSWFYLVSSTSKPRTAGWMTVCDDCGLQVDFFVEQQEYYPWEKVNALRNDLNLQSQHPPGRAKSKYLEKAKHCPRCHALAEQLSWLYFVNPEPASESLTIGWMAVCDRCGIQVNFFEEFSLKQYPWERVNASRNDRGLQGKHPPEEGKSEHVERALPCPICNTPTEQLTWLYVVNPDYPFTHELDSGPLSIGWMSVCDQCNVQIDFFEEFSRFQYSWERVNACRGDESLQSQHSLKKARGRYLKEATPCPICNMPAERLLWFYFISAEQDWKALAGRAGWMSICTNCNIQVDLFVEILS